MQVRGLSCIKVRQVVIAITLTPVKRHMQFVTSAPNFRGSVDPPDPAFPTPDQHNMGPPAPQWHLCSAAGKVTGGQASYWPCVTDFVVYPPMASKVCETEISSPPAWFCLQPCNSISGAV